MKKLVNIFRILLQVTSDFLSIWQLYGFSNLLRIFFPLLFKKQSLAIRHQEGTFYYHLEQYRRVSLNQIVHSYPILQNFFKTIPSDASVDTIFDLGANCGHFSLLAHAKYPHAKIFAFEPSPHLVPILKQNFQNKPIVLDQRAVSDTTGLLNFYINPAGQQTNSLLKDSVTPFNKEKNLEVLQVKADTLDNICKEYKINKIDILKIDCQGAEAMILKGGTAILEHTQFLILELSFLDADIFSMIQTLNTLFPYHKVIDAVSFGANVVFAKKAFNL